MQRQLLINDIEQQFIVHPVVALLGPRQCGKTTLARAYAEHAKTSAPVHFFDLEDPDDANLLRLNAMALLRPLRGLVVIDEVQHMPELFPLLRVLADANRAHTRFLILGSASRDLIRNSSETLAGRVGHIEVTPFSLQEFRLPDMQRLWLRGGFPLAYLADSPEKYRSWQRSYVSTFLERDLPALGIQVPPSALRRFWMMLAHYHGQVVNFSELGRSFNATDNTVRRYLDILSGTFMIRLLPPWWANVKKRQMKAPKLYIRDSGLFHFLLGVGDQAALLHHPKLGASWEGFATEQIIRTLRAQDGEVYYWSAYGRAEVDLLVLYNGRFIGFEIKFKHKATMSKSLTTAINTLELSQTYIVHPGQGDYALGENIRSCGLEEIVARLVTMID